MPFALTVTPADDTDGRSSVVNRESMPRISIGDCSLYYERHGMGFPILFVSGLGGFASFWQDQIAAFAKRFEVVTFDHRGIGQSDQARIGYTVERMAADVVSLMDALRIKRAHVVGHPNGGAISQVRAIDHPGRLPSVVLSATWTKADAYFRRLFTFRKEVLLRLGPSAYLQSATLYWYPSWWVARNNERLRQLEAQNLANFAPVEIVASRIDAMLAFDRSNELARFKTPTPSLGVSAPYRALTRWIGLCGPAPNPRRRTFIERRKTRGAGQVDQHPDIMHKGRQRRNSAIVGTVRAALRQNRLLFAYQ